MSLQQLEHMFQQDFTGEFDQYSTTFCDDLGKGTTADIDLSTLNKSIRNVYVEGDKICEEAANQKITNALPGVDSYTTFFKNEFNHASIQGMNTSEDLIDLIEGSLSDVCVIDDWSTLR